MENPKVELMNFWSTWEGDCFDGKGFISKCNGGERKRPTYHHFQMIAKNFYGNFYRGEAYSGTSSTQLIDVKTFASAQPAGFTIMVLNQSSSTSYPFNIDFKDQNASVAGQLNLDFNFTPEGSGYADSSSTYTDLLTPIEARSTVLLQFICHGRLLSRIDYTEQMAINDQTPQLRQIGEVSINPNVYACGQSGIGGTYNSAQIFTNDTVYVTSDIILTSPAL